MAANADPIVFEMTRRFNHPRDTVWQAWSQADQLQRWWGPAGCTIEVVLFEFRPGGFFHYGMTFDQAPTMWGRFNYREIAGPGRLVWLNSFANARGGIARAPFADSCPLEIQNTVTITEQAGVTTVMLQAQPFGELPAERQYFDDLQPSLELGYGGTFDRLADHLTSR
jgi:uncharacterized protein YndB with AHSA1/START domain